MRRRFVSPYAKFQTTCPCGRTTTKAYARANGGKCKGCVTGVVPERKGNEYGNDGYEQWGEDAAWIRRAESGFGE